MSIAKRLYLLLTLAILALFGVGGFGGYQMSKVYDAANYANINVVPSIIELNIVDNQFGLLRLLIWQHIALNDLEQRKKIEATTSEAHQKILATFARYEKEDISDDKDASLLKEAQKAYADYTELRLKALALSNEGKDEEAKTLLMAGSHIPGKVYNAIKAHLQFNKELRNI